jgi:DNA-binding response OmpR family regulator
MAKKNTKSEASQPITEQSNLQNQAKILIIDDERFLRQSVKKILERAGFYCETALDYSSAKKCLENLKFDLILADIVLPKMNGIEMISKLQEEFEMNSAIIFITGEPNLKTCTKAIRIGASDYLEKPVSRDVLNNAIKRVLIKRKHELNYLENGSQKSITLNKNFLVPETQGPGVDLTSKLKQPIENMHQSLVKLKKKFGDSFNEEQRALLNNIAQNNSSLKKLIKKFED